MADGENPTDTDVVDPAVERALLEHASESIYLLSDTGDIVARTGNPVGPLGYAQEDPEATRHPAEHVHPDDLISVLAMVGRVRATPGTTESVRVRARHSDGTWRMLEGTVTHAGADPRLHGAVLRTRDITLLVADQPSDGDAFRSLAEAVPSGILSADTLGWVVFTNEAARRILGLPADALRGRGWESVVHPEDLPDVVAASGAVLGSSAGEQVTFRVKSGPDLRWVHARFVPLRADVPGTPAGEGPHMGWIATLDDITDRRRAESKLAHQATHDPLTGLPNRNLLTDRLEQAAARQRRDGTDLAALFIDLDGFKLVNDRYGHQVGDHVLQEVARRLHHVLRASDTAARVGGDEFVVVCEAITPDEAAQVAARVEAAMAVPFLIDATHCEVGASVGIAHADGRDTEATDLLMRADQDMYRRKLARIGSPA